MHAKFKNGREYDIYTLKCVISGFESLLNDKNKVKTLESIKCDENS